MQLNSKHNTCKWVFCILHNSCFLIHIYYYITKKYIILYNKKKSILYNKKKESILYNNKKSILYKTATKKRILNRKHDAVHNLHDLSSRLASLINFLTCSTVNAHASDRAIFANKSHTNPQRSVLLTLDCRIDYKL